MIKINVSSEVDNAIKECLKNGVNTQALVNVNLEMAGDRKIVANELGIALFEIFEKDPEIVSKAVDYATRQIEKHHKEEN